MTELLLVWFVNSYFIKSFATHQSWNDLSERSLAPERLWSPRVYQLKVSTPWSLISSFAEALKPLSIALSRRII
jgi:hypothetical protein